METSISLSLPVLRGQHLRRTHLGNHRSPYSLPFFPLPSPSSLVHVVPGIACMAFLELSHTRWPRLQQKFWGSWAGKMAQLERSLSPRLVTWVQSLWPSRRKEQTPVSCPVIASQELRCTALLLKRQACVLHNPDFPGASRWARGPQKSLRVPAFH